MIVVDLYPDGEYLANLVYNNFYDMYRKNNFLNDNSMYIINYAKQNSIIFQTMVNHLIYKSLYSDPYFSMYILTNHIVWNNYDYFRPAIKPITENIIYNLKNHMFRENMENLMPYLYDNITKVVSSNCILNETSQINIELILYRLKLIFKSKLITDYTEQSFISNMYELMEDSVQQFEPMSDPLYDGIILSFCGDILDKLYSALMNSINSNQLLNREELTNLIYYNVTKPLLFGDGTSNWFYANDKFIYNLIMFTNPFNYQDVSDLNYLEKLTDFLRLSPYQKMFANFVEHFSLMLITHFIETVSYAFDFSTTRRGATFHLTLLMYIDLMKEIMGVK